MRRYLIAVLMVTLTVGFVPQATAHVRHDPIHWYCRTSDGNGWSARDVRQAIRCAVSHWSVSGGVHKALRVAKCESGFNEKNRNSTSSASGVYQFLRGTWHSVKQHYREVRRRFDLMRSVFNARANVMLAIRYAHAGGWSPWSCA